jgi:ribosomal protein S18 acetylase RimI-like enzyme
VEIVSAVSLRRETEGDLEFLKDLYAASRERELVALLDWSDEQKREFLDQQFSAQRCHYLKHYPDAQFDIIERSGLPIGRLYVAELAQEIRLMDIALMPEARNLGIGGMLCSKIMANATNLGKIVSLHVEEDNPAKRLYERLEFATVGEVTFYKLMHWCPEGLAHISEELSAQLNTAS